MKKQAIFMVFATAILMMTGVAYAGSANSDLTGDKELRVQAATKTDAIAPDVALISPEGGPLIDNKVLRTASAQPDLTTDTYMAADTKDMVCKGDGIVEEGKVLGSQAALTQTGTFVLAKSDTGGDDANLDGQIILGLMTDETKPGDHEAKL